MQSKRHFSIFRFKFSAFSFQLSALLAACLPSGAQTMAPDFKGAGNNNPISAIIHIGKVTFMNAPKPKL